MDSDNTNICCELNLAVGNKLVKWMETNHWENTTTLYAISRNYYHALAILQSTPDNSNPH